jgi:hypothetical protein
MRTIPATLVVLAVVALVWLSGSSPVPAQPPPKAPQHEYKFLPLTHGGVQPDEERLNKLAAEGWEVVTGTTQSRNSNNSPPSDTRLVLKRAKQ